MRTLTVFLLGVLTVVSMQAQIIHVPGDYPTIRQAVDAALTGDTVLVSPGTYTENISISGKSVMLASLFLLTQDPFYITATILDGNHAGTVVKMESCTAPVASLCGFTLMDGEGCGIKCNDANPVLKNLIVKNNSTSYCGGGIGIFRTNESITEPILLEDIEVIENSSGYCGGGIGVVNNNGSPLAMVLKNVIISGNTAADRGGGLYLDIVNATMENVTITGNSASSGGGIASFNACTLTFDTIHRCNIHSNVAIYGSDLSLDRFTNDILIAVDTFSVLHPTAFHATSWWSPLSFDILHGKHEQYRADLYVSPSGNNANSGLTDGEPLKTIHSAFSYMLADSLDPHTVHLLEGTYCPHTNGEHFPLNIPDYVDLCGVSDSSVILDADSTDGVLRQEKDYSQTIRGITVSGGKGYGLSCTQTNPVLKDMTITGNWGSGLDCYISSPTLENVRITRNITTGYGGGICCSYSSNPILSEVTIRENTAGYGGGMYLSGNSNPVLGKVSISRNTALYGGGMYLKTDSRPVFDTINRCSIYLNSALNSSTGHDLLTDNTDVPLRVILDTFTVLHPKAYHASPLDKFTFDILHGKTPQYTADLYVSPLGNDGSTGLTAEDPLKTLAYAFSRILADSLHACSVSLAPGTYSPSATGEPFPVKMESYVSLKGASPGSVSLDGERKYQVAEARNIKGVILENLSVINGLKLGYGGGVVCEHSALEISDVVFANNSSRGYWIPRMGGFIQGLGGGLYASFSELRLRNVTFTDDTADCGGGLYAINSRLESMEVNVRQNTARKAGGGLFASRSDLSFDTLHRSNIYGNSALDGNDIYSDSLMHVVADTFSVKFPTDFYLTPLTHFTSDVLHGLLEQEDADLFVAPWGNNGNPGVSRDAPLRTLDAAFRRIRADSLSRHTLHLMNGTYSPSGTGEMFPLNIPDFLRVEGAGDSVVILDAEGNTGAVEILENTMTGLSGLTVTGGKAGTGAGIYCLNSDAVVQGVIVVDNNGIDGGGIGCVNSKLQLTGSRISGNHVAGIQFQPPGSSRWAHGGGLYGENSQIRIFNTLFDHNTFSMGYGGGVYLGEGSRATLDNLTIEGNTRTTTSGEGAGICCESFWEQATVRNSIIWNNQPDMIYGEADVTYSNLQKILPGEGNLSTNPQFIGHGAHPYMLTAASACRNAGTPDTTGMFLPATDLAGGPRIWGERIDMGAYEWSNVGKEELEVGSRQFAVRSFPEPFIESTTFSYKIDEPSQVTLQIFDGLGTLVAEPVTALRQTGEQRITWNSWGLPAGMYYYRVQAGKQVGSGKIVKM